MKRLRLGFVGVGKWARQLLEVFHESEEIQVWGHCRNKTDAEPGFGDRVDDWKRLCSAVDLVVAAADPEPTTEVALWCAENCIPVLATKPLLSHPQILFAPFFVDLWRFWSSPYRAMSNFLTNESALIGPKTNIRSMEIDFHGSGPYRPKVKGLDDYGPHAISFLLRLLDVRKILDFQDFRIWNTQDARGGEIYTLHGTIDNVTFGIRTGNGSGVPKLCVQIVDLQDNHHSLTESDGQIVYRYDFADLQKPPAFLRSSKHAALLMFAKTVLKATRNYYEEGGFYLSTTFMNSYLSTEVISRMRGMPSQERLFPNLGDIRLN